MSVFNWKIGEKASITKKATEDIFLSLAEVSNDFNPIHFDDEYAKESGFAGRIAHGLFCLSMVSYLVGMEMPGRGSIFLDEKVEYKRPVYLNDEITTSVEIVAVDRQNNRVNVAFKCVNQCDKIVLIGNTLVRVID